MSDWVSSTITPILGSLISLSNTMFSLSGFKALLIAVLGLSVMGLILGLIKR